MEYQDAMIEHLPPKGKWNEPAIASSEYDLMVGIGPGLRYVFVGKSNETSTKRNLPLDPQEHY